MNTARRLTPLFTVGLLFLAACSHQPARQQFSFTGTVKAGERFDYRGGDKFHFTLEPYTEGIPERFATGWIIRIYEQGKPEDLLCLTLPLHGPNPTVIEGWHFRNEANTGPNDGSVNVPQYEREFIFSPEVIRILGAHEITEDDIRRVESFGRGALHIQQLKLSPPERGQQASILEMRFHCTLSWPRLYEKSAGTSPGVPTAVAHFGH